MNILSSKYRLIKAYTLDFGYLEIYPNFAIGSMIEGADISLEDVSVLTSITETHYRNKSFGYISYRKNSYAVDPTLYTHIREINNLKGIAIVSDKESFKYNYKIEKYFYGKKMRLFKTVEDASEWMLGIVDES